MGVPIVTVQDQRRYVQTIEVRGQASELLRRLIADQRRSEQRLAQGGGRDPLKSLTGRSAIDRAIDETRQLITDMDCMLNQLRAKRADGACRSSDIETTFADRLEPAAV